MSHIGAVLTLCFTSFERIDSAPWRFGGEIAKHRAIFVLLAATMITLGAAPTFAYNDRNNEPACAQIGSVDPRCF